MRQPANTGAALRLAGTILCMLSAACAGSGSRGDWKPVEDARFVAQDGTFSLELPLGWLRAGQVLMRDPEGPEVITFNAGPVLAESTVAIDASAPELMLAMRDELEARPWVRVLDCRAVTIGELPGFRIHYQQRWDPEGEAAAPHEQLIYGAIDGETLFAFSLEAPADAGFALDLETFERMVTSFRRLPESD
jgi:hypothetical protein